MASLLTTISYYDLMTTCAKLNKEKAQNIYNNKTLLDENWINATEWTQGTPLKASFDIHEIETASQSKPAGSKGGAPFKHFNRFISASETIDSSFPFNVPSIVSHIMSKEFDVEADRVAGYFTGTGTLYGQYYETSGNENKYGVSCRGDYFVLRKALNGTLTTITNNTFNKSNSLMTNVKKLGYSNALYEDYTTGGQTYNGHYNCYSTVTSEINNFASMFDNIFYTLSTNSSCLAKTDVTLTTNFLLFKNQAECDYYLQTGDASKAIKPKEEPEENEKEWFITSNIFRCLDTVKSDFTLQDKNETKYYYETGEDTDGNYGKSRPVAGYVMDNITDYAHRRYNIEMLENPDASFIKGREKIGQGNEVVLETFDVMTNNVWAWSVPHSGNEGFFYYGINQTNIPIFATRDDVLKYFRGEIGLSSALNQGGKYIGKDSDIGAKKTTSTINSNNLNAPNVSALYGGFANLGALNSAIYDEQNITEILDGLKLNGEMPLSFILDCYKTPFDVNTFVSGSPVSTLHFGTYEAHLSMPLNLANISEPKQMFSVYMSPTFDDFRDYLSNYYLYLPFVGITELQPEQWLYNTMSCSVVFDIYTGNIKYYLKCNDVVVDMFEGCARVSLPMIGTDNYTATMSKINGASSIASGTVGAMASVASGTPSGIANGIINGVSTVFTGATELTKATPKQLSGNVSASVAFHDEITAYLIIEQAEIVYGDNITNQYGLPDNRVDVIGRNSGFIACNDVIMSGRASEEEKNRIKAILQSGIYL